MEASVHLTTFARTAIIGVVLLAAVYLANSAHSQGVADGCAREAQQSWPDDYEYGSYGRARQQVYTNCMMKHGLRP
jgi:hypothetical protein